MSFLAGDEVIYSCVGGMLCVHAKDDDAESDGFFYRTISHFPFYLLRRSFVHLCARIVRCGMVCVSDWIVLSFAFSFSILYFYNSFSFRSNVNNSRAVCSFLSLVVFVCLPFIFIRKIYIFWVRGARAAFVYRIFISSYDWNVYIYAFRCQFTSSHALPASCCPLRSLSLSLSYWLSFSLTALNAN